MESSIVEYKRELPPKAKSMKAEIVSFLNSPTGGTIFLGVEDDGVPVTFASEELRKTTFKDWESTISNWIATAFKPDITGLVLLEINENEFKIAISSGVNKPYFFTDGEGINYKGIYVRAGSSKRLASHEEIKRMMQKHISNVFDGEQIEQATLDFTYAKNIFKTLDKRFDVVGLGLKTSESSKYNNTALIISDENPNIAKLAVYDGVDTIMFKDKKKFTGSIISQIDSVLTYLKLVNHTGIIIGSEGKRIEYPSYPEVALREAIVNAFVHRDYTLTPDIRIEIFNDRIEIASPGSLPDGLTVNDIRQGANAKRNPTLINALDKMEYIENYGSGIRRIYALYKGFLKQPQLIATENLFTIVLYNRNYKLNKLDLNEQSIAVLKYLSDGKVASRQEIQDALGYKKSYTTELISKLRKLDIISSEGNGPATKYYLSDL